MGCRQTGTFSNAAVKKATTARVAAELQDDTCVITSRQHSHVQSVSVSEPVQFGDGSSLDNAWSMCIHDGIWALMVTVTSICRAAAGLLQQLCLTLCAALRDFVNVLSDSRSPSNLNPKRGLGLAHLKLLHLQSHSCQVLLSITCRRTLPVLLLSMSLLQACVLHQAPPSALVRHTGLCAVLRHALKACIDQEALRWYQPP